MVAGISSMFPRRFRESYPTARFLIGPVRPVVQLQSLVLVAQEKSVNSAHGLVFPHLVLCLSTDAVVHTKQGCLVRCATVVASTHSASQLSNAEELMAP